MEVNTSLVSAALNASAATSVAPPRAVAQGLVSRVGMTVPFAVGIFGNLLALFILRRTRSSSNQKHGFMLRCLITSDCIALTGMLIQVLMGWVWPELKHDVWLCRCRVLWRFFGLGSGCVAFVMAVERWLALTKPFFYQKHISLRLLKRMLIFLWLLVLCLVCAPFFGVGLYWDQENLKCERYRDAKKPLDVLYAYLYTFYGVGLCLVILYTNLAVIKTLCMKDGPHSKQNVLMRRTSRGSSLMCNTATREERAFGWLMFLLCIAFVVCWIPQMVTTLLVRWSVLNGKLVEAVGKTADILLAIHFALDPYLYVLQHWTLVKSICRRRTLRGKNVQAGGGSASVSRSSSVRTTATCFPCCMCSEYFID